MDLEEIEEGIKKLKAQLETMDENDHAQRFTLELNLEYLESQRIAKLAETIGFETAFKAYKEKYGRR